MGSQASHTIRQKYWRISLRSVQSKAKLYEDTCNTRPPAGLVIETLDKLPIAAR